MKTNEVRQKGANYTKTRRQRKRWQTIVACLACVVVFCTTYALILPAITLEKDTYYCGKTEHTHSEECMTQTLICQLEENEGHVHTEECYETVSNLICEEEDAEHIHTEECYEDVSILVCQQEETGHTHTEECYETSVTCGLEEHTHSDSCLKSVEGENDPSDEDVDGESDADTKNAETKDTGTDDGIAAQDLDVANLDGKSFALVNGATGYAVMNTSNNDNWTKLDANTSLSTRVEENENGWTVYSNNNVFSEEVVIWTFEKTGTKNNTYYITTTLSGVKYYLYIDGTTVGVNANHAYTNEKGTDCSVITVEEATKETYAGQVRLTNSDGWAINRYGGKAYFGGYNDGLANEYFYLVTEVVRLDNVSTVEGMSPGGTVINMFDYWTNEKVDGDRLSEKGDYVDGNLTTGINTYSDLHFVITNDNQGLNNINGYGGSSVRDGIVEKVLSDGYPVLSGTYTNNPRSLDYLFDPDENTDYRDVYRGVTGLLSLDDTGYYYYDSTKNFAELNKESGEITLYNTWGVSAAGNSPDGQFFPFNTFAADATSNSRSSTINHYFGMTLTARFVQQYDGYTDSSKSQPMTFEFSGDDDVWIFIDDVLVADLGGIHDAASVKIDFVSGEVTINGNVSTSLYEAFDNAGKAGETEWSTDTNSDGKFDTFANDTYHTLKFFYLERGNSDSNLYLKYNLKEIPSSSIVKVDQYGDAVPNAEFALYAATKDANGNYLYKLDDTDVDGKPIYTSLDSVTYTITYEDETNADGKTIKAGTITITSGDYNGKTITPIYAGYTDNNGNMTFVDKDRMPLALADLEEMAGGASHFILREIVVPNGYRVISDEVWLFLENNILYCNNIYTSGAYASATAQITATDYIYLNDTTATDGNGNLAAELKNSNVASKVENTNTVKVHYYDPSQNPVQVNGTLFAVVLKYNGDADTTTPTTEMGNQANWVPVYGDDISGYLVQEVNKTGDVVSRNDFINAVIETAVTMEKTADYSDSVFELAASGSMQVVMTELPGSLQNYYSMLLKSWNSMTEEGKLAYGNDINKYLAKNMEYTVGYYWTTADELYTVNANGETTIKATPANTFRVNIEADTTNSYDGFDRTFGANIEVPNLVNRLLVQKLDNAGNKINGATFAMYKVGQSDNEKRFYYIADDGTKIYLDSDSDGDNIGTVSVGGAAADYRIDETTGVITVTVNEGNSYIISPVDTKTTNSDSIAKENGTAVFGHRNADNGSTLEKGYYIVREISAPQGYKLNTSEVQVLVDDTAIYANAGTEGDGVTVARGPGYVVSTLDKFASQGEIDNTLTWVYEQLLVSEETTSFAEVYQALAENSGWRYLSSYTGSGYNAKTTFVEEQKDALTTYLVYAPDDSGNGDTLFNYTINVERKADVGANIGNTRRLYTSVGWSYYLLYQDYEYGMQNKHENANYEELVDDAGNLLEISNLFSRSTYIQVADEYNELTIQKVDSTDETQSLEGAEFTLKRVVKDSVNGEITTYYEVTGNNDGNGNISYTGTWKAVTGNDTIPVITTDAEGKISLTGLIDGTYILTETKAPDGYQLLTSPVTFTVKSGVIAASTGNMVEYDSQNNVLKVKNSAGAVLPNTGGAGAYCYIFSGLLLMAGAVMYGYRLRRRRERRGLE